MPTKSQFYQENICRRMEPLKNEGGGVRETCFESVNRRAISYSGQWWHLCQLNQRDLQRQFTY